MKRYTIPRYSRKQPFGKKPESAKHNKVIVILSLIAGVFFIHGESPSEQKQSRRSLSAPAVYAAEIPQRAKAPGQVDGPSSNKIDQIIQETAIRVQQSKMMNSSTCGRPWKLPLTKIHGKIHNVEYKEQPFTKRRGLHLDVETGPQTYTVIHIYPERLTSLCPSVFHFRVGETLTVTGSEFFTGLKGMQQNICASTITKGEDEEEVLSIRDPQTGDLEQQLCCQQICENNCIGLPPMCGQICAMNCERRVMKAVFQNLPFNPSQDKQYRTATY